MLLSTEHELFLKKKKSTEHELKSLEKKTVIKEEHNGKVKKFFFSRGQ